MLKCVIVMIAEVNFQVRRISLTYEILNRVGKGFCELHKVDIVADKTSTATFCSSLSMTKLNAQGSSSYNNGGSSRINTDYGSIDVNEEAFKLI